jgi:hypothetical protein
MEPYSPDQKVGRLEGSCMGLVFSVLSKFSILVVNIAIGPVSPAKLLCMPMPM